MALLSIMCAQTAKVCLKLARMLNDPGVSLAECFSLFVVITKVVLPGTDVRMLFDLRILVHVLIVYHGASV